MSRAWLLALCIASACYSSPSPDCGFVCGPGGACPEGYSCASDNVCHRDGTPSTLVCAVDAAPPMIDANLDDAPPDADVTRPQVMTATPATGATDVARDTTITIVFSEPVMNVSGTTFLVDDGNTVPGALATQSETTYVFTPSMMLAPNAAVTVTLNAGITDLAGNALVQTVISFSTGT